MKRTMVIISLLSALLLNGGCNKESSNTLAPYTAQRSLFFTRITINAKPDIQWLGGRAMAIGVNRGTKAALDSTLVWLQTATDNDISSAVTFGASSDRSRVTSYGGTPADSLDSDVQYTFWVATKEAFDARLDTSKRTVNPSSFADSICSVGYWLKGQSGGEGGTSNPIVRIKIRRDQTLEGEKFTIFWTPATSAFNRLAVRTGSTGGWTDLLWHINTPTGTTDNILPPVVIGVPPAGVIEGTPWGDNVFVNGTTYTIWMANRNWNGVSFTLTARGYAYFRFSSL